MRRFVEFRDVKAVLCDAVGTLIEAEPSVASAYTATAARQGVALDLAVVRARFRAAFAADEARALAGTLTTDERAERTRWRNLVAEVMPELPDLDRAFEELWLHFGRTESWFPFGDVAPALRSLQAQGLTVRIASNFDTRLRPVLAGMPALAPWASELVISSEVGWRKPAAGFFRAACAQLGLPPSSVLHVGDHPVNDITGARRAGLLAALIGRGQAGMNPTREPCFANLTELAEALGARAH